MHIILFYLSGISFLAFIWYFIESYYAIGLLAIYLINKYFNGPCNKNQADLTNKVIVVTGGFNGIGYETVIGLSKLNATVIACGRMIKWREALEEINKMKTITKHSNIQFFDLDLDNKASVEKFIKDLNQHYPDGIDILINNAGLIETKEIKTKEGVELQFGVNYLARFHLTLGLLDLLHKKPESRIINVSSSGYKKGQIDFEQIEKNKTTTKQFNSTLCYRNSKLANILFTKYLALRLKSNQIKCMSLHPGFVRTNIVKFFLWRILFIIFYPLYALVTKSAFYGAQTTIHCCTEEFQKLQSGEYYADCKREPLSHKQLNLVTMKKLWELSLALCGLKDNLQLLKEYDEVTLDNETKKNQ